MRTWQGQRQILFVAFLFFWFYGLGIKPIHHDEAVNAWWLTQITQLGYFPYDPTNYHGPLFFYIQWIFQLIFGDELWTLRLPGVLFSLAGVLLLWKKGYPWGALALLVSPAFLFFSRSAIHEPMFVFFQLVLFLGILDYAEGKEKAFQWIVFGLVGSLALKETWVISGIAMIPSIFILGVRSFKIGRKQICALLFGIFLTAIPYSGFFQNMSGIFDFFKAFLPWLRVGTESIGGHNKPFFYWGDLILRYEPVIFLIFLMATRMILSSKKTAAIFAFAVSQIIIYSLIPYKTPWCLITILWPFALLADFSIHEIPWKKLLFAIFGLALVAQVYTSYKLTFKSPIDFTHPYVYVQSSQELKEFADSIEDKGPVLIFLQDTWPFPWVFRKNLKLQYTYEHMPEDQIMDNINQAQMIVTEEKYRHWIEKSSQKFHMKSFFLRDHHNEIFIYERPL